MTQRHDRQSRDQRYNGGARFFHWTIALLITGMFASNWLREAMERGSPERAWWLAAHMSLGISIFILTLLRVLWRMTHRVPEPAPASPIVHAAAKLGHLALYLFTLGLPVTGALRGMSGGGGLIFYGIPIPSLTGKDDALRATIVPFHDGLIMYLLLALVAGHVLAALWHQFVVRDGTLSRMV